MYHESYTMDCIRWKCVCFSEDTLKISDRLQEGPACVVTSRPDGECNSSVWWNATCTQRCAYPTGVAH